jgi:hypothetical protein
MQYFLRAIARLRTWWNRPRAPWDGGWPGEHGPHVF